jgi:hypothetical protein
LLLRRPQLLGRHTTAATDAVSRARSNASSLWSQSGKCALMLTMALALGACDTGGGGGSGGSSSASVASVQAIDLPEGLTAATLGWAPSEGTVDNYLVYESRNGGDLTFVDRVIDNQITIPGNPGDSVIITVIAVSNGGQSSSASPPSPELRFHSDPNAQPVAAATATTQTAYAAPPISASTSAPVESADATDAAAESALVQPAADEAASTVYTPDNTSDNTSDNTPDNTPDSSDSEGTEGETSVMTLDASMRDLLIESNARLPLAGLSDVAQNWLQSRIEEQFTAGVRLVGTGEIDRDGLRELIWQDPSGQLFVSAGSALAALDETADVPSTFVEGVRLRATEHFLALGDFTGDGMGEWLIENAATGDLLFVDAETFETTNARSLPETADPTTSVLVGHGDFDGDGREDLLWQLANAFGDLELRMELRIELQIERSTDSAASVTPLNDRLSDALPMAFGNRVVAVADIDGNGLDDLLATRPDGVLESTLVFGNDEGTPSVRFEAAAGPDLSTDGLEWLATLDVDQDGRAEIAWLNGEQVEIWDPINGPRTSD